jgi:hypothetical protein
LLGQHTGIDLKDAPMILLLVMVVQISAAMAIGFVLGRIWQIRCDLEQQRGCGFTPPIARIPLPTNDPSQR